MPIMSFIHFRNTLKEHRFSNRYTTFKMCTRHKTILYPSGNNVVTSFVLCPEKGSHPERDCGVTEIPELVPELSE
jgi:hypothetical protein